MKNRYFFIIFALLAVASYLFVWSKWPDKKTVTTPVSQLQVTATTPPIDSSSTSTQASDASSTPTNQEARTEAIEYTVQSGDTISTIAKKFNVSVSTVLSANNLEPNSLISPKDKLKILPISGATYQVKSGDTLSTIASELNIDPSKLMAANNLTESSKLKINQLLIIPEGARLSTPRATAKTATVAKSTKPATKPTTKKTVTTNTKVSGVVWTAAALRELRKVPSFVRSIVKGKITNYAKSHGIKVITPAVYKKIKV